MFTRLLKIALSQPVAGGCNIYRVGTQGKIDFGIISEKPLKKWEEEER